MRRAVRVRAAARWIRMTDVPRDSAALAAPMRNDECPMTTMLFGRQEMT
jgi:hypothetical protein